MSTNQDLIALLQKQIRSLQAQNESLRNQLAAERKGVDNRDEEIQKIMKAILDSHELNINLTDKVNGAIIERLKNLMSND